MNKKILLLGIFAVLMIGVCSFVTATVTDSFIMDFDNPYSTTQTDVSSFNNATVYNNTWLDFDGIDDYITIPDSPSLTTGSGDITLSAWIYPNDTSTTERAILMKHSTSNDGNQEWGLSTWFTNRLKFYYGNSTNANSVNGDAATQLTDKVWSLGTITYKNSTNNITFFVNGVQKYFVELADGAADLARDTSTVVVAGSISSGTPSAFFTNGSLSKLQAYNTSLSVMQIKREFDESVLGNNYGQSIPILNYHRINDTHTDEFTVNINNFTAHMDYLYNNGYETITYKNYSDWRNGTFIMPDKPVIIDFDDGYQDTLETAFPIMQSRGFIGVVEIISALADLPCSFRPFMCWDEIKQLEGWEIGSHSNDSEAYVVSDFSIPEMLERFNKSKLAIEGNLSITVNHFQYPGNDNNDTTDTECAKVYGFCMGTTNQAGDPSIGYTYKSSNLTHSSGILPARRIHLRNDSTFQDFVNSINYRDNLMLDSKLQESSGTKTFDISGNNNNGTIVSSTWDNDGVKINLTENLDYTLTSSTYTLLDQYYHRQWVELDYDCTVPTEDLTITTNTTFCAGTYYLNDTNGNGAIIIGANDVWLDCNGARIQGNSTADSEGINTNSGLNGVNIQNCNIDGYTRGIDSFGPKNMTINNNTITNVLGDSIRLQVGDTINITNNTINGHVTHGIYMDRGQNSYIFNNIVLNGSRNIRLDNHDNSLVAYNTLSNSTRAIYIDDNSLDNIITNNRIFDNELCFLVETYSLRTNITSNNISGGVGTTIGFQIEDGANSTYIFNNTISDSHWNGIDIRTYHNVILNNTMYNISHNCIDLNGEVGITDNGYNNISGNTCIGAGENGIYLVDGVFNNIYDNTFINMNNSGLVIEGNNSAAFGNSFYNNTVVNASSCIFTSSTNSTFTSNTVSDCRINSVKILSWFEDRTQLDNSVFLNNNYLDGYAIYMTHAESNPSIVNFTVNETSTSFHNINFSGNGIFSMAYSGRKDFRADNISFTINNMPTSFNQFFNGTDATPQEENFNTLTYTVPDDVSSFTFSQDSATDPKYTSIATTITDMTYDYTGTGGTLTINCEGSGNILLTNMNDISDVYAVYHSGSLVGFSETNDYTISSCSEWSFSPTSSSDPLLADSGQKFIVGLSIFATMISLLALAIVGAFIFRMYANQKIDLDELKRSIIVIGTVAVIVLITIAVITVMAGLI
jgi:peptidoglycan/xylan/chitin deacetylase (PgdA/CDA1 family)